MTNTGVTYFCQWEPGSAATLCSLPGASGFVAGTCALAG
jgi:hypothetical protein